MADEQKDKPVAPKPPSKPGTATPTPTPKPGTQPERVPKPSVTYIVEKEYKGGDLKKKR